MNTSYTFTTLRYVHDVVTGEFANIGLLMYAPAVNFLETRFLESFGRLNRFFGAVQSSHLKRVVRHLQGGAIRLSDEFFGNGLFHPDLPDNAAECARLLLPPDDSALQFSRLASGLTDDPWLTLDQLFARYIGRYAGISKPEGRRDNEIWRVFRAPLIERVPRVHLEPYRVIARNYEHQFPFSWRNGILNVAEAVSFDLRDSQEIQEKAARWLGRGIALAQGSERFRMALLLGEPTDDSVYPAFEKATNMLAGIPGEKILFSEREPESFAEFVKTTLEHTELHRSLPKR